MHVMMMFDACTVRAYTHERACFRSLEDYLSRLSIIANNLWKIDVKVEKKENSRMRSSLSLLVLWTACLAFVHVPHISVEGIVTLL